jgi:hypothetical protein
MVHILDDNSNDSMVDMAYMDNMVQLEKFFVVSLQIQWSIYGAKTFSYLGQIQPMFLSMIIFHFF